MESGESPGGGGENGPASRLGLCFSELRPVCRRGKRQGRLWLLINEELGPETPHIATLLILLLSPFWYVGVCGGGGLGDTAGAWPVD